MAGQEESGVFRQDLIAAARALLRDPRLPALSLALALPSFLPGLSRGVGSPNAGLAFLLLPVSLLLFGYFGVERVWYLRLFRGQEMSFREIWLFSWHFVGRYLALALIVGLLFLPLLVPLVIESVEGARELAEEARRTGQPFDPAAVEDRLYTPTLLILSLGLGLLMDFVLTFTTPALAFSTRSVWAALKENVNLIRRAAPASLIYVLIPPLAALITLRLVPPTRLGQAAWLALSMLGVFLNLLFKGATAAFYLRHHPEVGDFGAVDA